jgi:hypothetical protein
MVRSPMCVDSIPAVALKFVTAFGADFVCHAHSLNPPSDLWKFKLHHYPNLRGGASSASI